MRRNALAVMERLQAARQQDGTRSETSLAIAAGREAALQTRLLSAGVPARYREARWDDVRVPEAREWQAGVLLEPQLRRGQGLLISGPVGTGKSSIAALIARETAQEKDGWTPRTVRWEYFPSMLDELEDRRERRKVEARQTAPALLVWDDFGVEVLAAWQPPLLDRIVEMRYRARKSTIITTNVEPRIIAQDPALERIFSRWQQMNKVLVVAGRDRRAGEQ